MSADLVAFPAELTEQIRAALADAHFALAQLHLAVPERSITARNYDSAIRSLGKYMDAQQERLPTRNLLERWRDEMLAGRWLNERGQPYALRSVNARLAAVRGLLRRAADNMPDMQIKLILRDWANLPDAKAIIQQDKTEEDFGIRLTRYELEAYVNSVDLTTIKGLRDRALIAVMAGAGLRVSEAVGLTLRDVFLTSNSTGQRGIRVRRGKHHRARIVVLGGWNNWVLDCVQSYIHALGLTPDTAPDAPVFRGVKRAKQGRYDSTAHRLSARGAERAVADYAAWRQGQELPLNAHDLRRTFAKLCKEAGMSWEALRDQMGHVSVTTTEDYVGKTIDWSERIPNWTIHLRQL